MRRSIVAVWIVVMVAMRADWSWTASPGVSAAPVTTWTVPTDPTTYEAQEWATFQLVSMPTEFGELEETLSTAYMSASYFLSPDFDKAYRMEVSPIIHQLDLLMKEYGPSVDLLEAAGRAGARDNDLADLAPELVMFYKSFESRLANIHELHNATLAFDDARWDAVAERLGNGRIPQSHLCAFYDIASETRWQSRFAYLTKLSVKRGAEIFGCSNDGAAGELSASVLPGA